MSPAAARPEDAAALALACRILVGEGVMDAFGHVSLRDPTDPERFWLPRAMAPNAVAPGDILVFGPDCAPVGADAPAVFAERFLHGAIYAARPDVMAVCHAHPPALMPFCLTDRPLVPLTQTGACMGGPVPLWDSAAEFGDTAMLIDDPAQAASLARAMGAAPLVLMRGHGVTVTGRSLAELVYRAVHACRDAGALSAAAALGVPQPLTPGEIARVGAPAPGILDRCWQFWTLRHGGDS